MHLRLTRSEPEIIDKFWALKSTRDISDLLELKHSVLMFHVFKFPPAKKYTTFAIPKKSGGVREIRAPISQIKIIQQKLNLVLRAVFRPKPCVHGFRLGKDIVSNAREHTNKKYVLNVDLKDFFPSINFAKVIGMFKAYPYNFDKDMAILLSRICCDEYDFPQGAPTSPIISNMICARMDSELKRLAQQLKCWYSRYGDDLTFSTSRGPFPRELAFYASSGVPDGVEVGGRLKALIESNGFFINERKVRLQEATSRQEVTGLIVNNRPNIDRRYRRQIRAMLHAWKKYGLENAEITYLTRFRRKYKSPFKPLPQFEHVVRGKIEFVGMVRGKSDRTYRIYLDQFNLLTTTSPGSR
jgi:RNA-directed DNA polymerase